MDLKYICKDGMIYMDKVNATKEKEEKNMASITKPMQATVIKKDKFKPFISALKENGLSDDYWENCRKAKNAISHEELEQMKKICNEGKK